MVLFTSSVLVNNDQLSGGKKNTELLHLLIVLK